MAVSSNSGHPHILLATDRAQGAHEHLAFATGLANKLGARITLYHASPPISLIVNAPLGENRADVSETVEEARQKLTDTASTLPTDRPVHVEVEEASDAKEAILAAAERLHADILVLPTHGRSGLSRAVLGSTAEQVVRRATKPVLLLTDTMLAHAARLSESAGPMVIATDLSPESIDAHSAAVAIGDRLGLNAHLLSVVTDSVAQPLEDGATILPEPIDDQPAIDARTKRLRQLALAIDTKKSIVIEAQVAHNPVQTIVQRAEQLESPLLVLTTHGRRGIQRMLVGSVAEQVVRRSTTPVLVMPMTAAQAPGQKG